MASRKLAIWKPCSKSTCLVLCSTSKRIASCYCQSHLFPWWHPFALFWKLCLNRSTATSNTLLSLLLFGVVEVHSHKRKISIIEKSLVIGGRVNGKQQPNLHPKVQFLTTTSSTLEIQMVASNLANMDSGLKYLKRSNSIQQEVISWAISQCQPRKV